MRQGVLVAVLVALASVAVGCTGDEETPVVEATTTSTQQTEGVASCWMEAAETARRAAEAAVPVLRDNLGTLIQREQALARAATAGDPAAFAAAFDRFLTATEPVVAPAALEKPLADSKSELASCRSAAGGAGGTVDRCWKEVASAYAGAANAAENAIQQGGAKVMFAVQTMIKAGEDRNVEDVKKSATDLSAGIEELQQLAAEYATELGNAQSLGDACEG